MPYVSKAQERWAHTPSGTKSLGGASKVKEWDSASKGMKLPARAKGHHTPARPKLNSQKKSFSSLKKFSIKKFKKTI